MKVREKPKIITLVGKSNTGKSSALKKLILKLISEYNGIVQDVPSAHKCPTFISPQKEEKLDSLLYSEGDAFTLIKIGNFNIGVSTSGDKRYNIEDKLNLLKAYCDLFICASRDKGGAFEYIEELSVIYEITRFYKMGCIGNQDDSKYELVKDYTDMISVKEILKCINVLRGENR